VTPRFALRSELGIPTHCPAWSASVIRVARLSVSSAISLRRARPIAIRHWRASPAEKPALAQISGAAATSALPSVSVYSPWSKYLPDYK
jgi:hypothetical protein